jgi:hypothetical protein
MKLSHSITALLSVAGLVLFTGCSKDNPTALNDGTEDYSLVATYENQSGEDIAKDVAGMSESFGFGAKLGKAQSGVGNIQWQVWNYGGGWWHRSGSFSLAAGEGEVELAGSDSVQFIDAANAPVQFPLQAEVRGGAIRHHVDFHLGGLDGGYVDAARNWALSASLTKTADDTSLTLSGSLNQLFRAENGEKSAWCNFEGRATVTGIVYSRNADGWSKPMAGTVTVSSPFKTIAIVFLNETAHITVTSKDGAVVKDVTINL